VRIRGDDGEVVSVVAAKGLKSVGFREMARFLLSPRWPMHWCSRC